MEIDTVTNSQNHSEPVHDTKDEQDLYMRMRELERELELLSMQEEFLKDEQRHLKSEYIRSKEEVGLKQIWLIDLDQAYSVCPFRDVKLCRDGRSKLRNHRRG